MAARRKTKAKPKTKAAAPPKPNPESAEPQEKRKGAPVGNRFWEMRSSHGRQPIFKNPEDLWAAATEYFAWVEANPLYEDKLFAYEGEITHAPAARMRAMTLGGLCIFLDIARSTFDEYASREGFSAITRQIAEVVRAQKFEGASAGLLNANIIARELGLADKQELTGKDGEAIKVEETGAENVFAKALDLVKQAARLKPNEA